MTYRSETPRCDYPVYHLVFGHPIQSYHKHFVMNMSSREVPVVLYWEILYGIDAGETKNIIMS